MKPIGMPPPRSKEIDMLLKSIWAEQCNQVNKASMPQVVLDDQMGTAALEREEPSIFDCCECGELYRIGKGFIHDGYWDKFWCEACELPKVQGETNSIVDLR